jgi:epoxyqueuosine reductase QueG
LDNHYETLKTLAFQAGASAFGIGEIGDLRDKFEGLSKDFTDNMDRGVSVGVRLSEAVLKGVLIAPTRHYLHHYRMVNMLLDQIAVRLTNELQTMGYMALPIPASQIVDWEAQTAHLSHKMIAVRAGVGWIGRNNLLIHPEFGSNIRLVTVLTDGAFATDKPLEANCGNCRACIKSCPVNAIGQTYQEWDKVACLEKLKYYSKHYNIGQYICGLCVKVCHGARTIRKAG